MSSPLCVSKSEPGPISTSNTWWNVVKNADFWVLPQTTEAKALQGKRPKNPPFLFFIKLPRRFTKAWESLIYTFTFYPSVDLNPKKTIFAPYQQSVAKLTSLLLLKVILSVFVDSRTISLQYPIMKLRFYSCHIFLCFMQEPHAIYSWLHVVAERKKKIYLLMDLFSSCCQKMESI